ncbi:MAG: 50S ribosomal protein L4 [archaeon]
MKAQILSLDGKESGTIELPPQFQEEFRPDIIKRAFYVIQNNNRQPYGTDPEAGLRTSARFIGRRRAYGTHQNKGMHRTKRIRSGSGYLSGRARAVPHAVKGRKAHPPKAEKDWTQKINRKERIQAIRSAITATTNIDLVKKRNHQIENIKLPIIIDDKFERLKKTKEVKDILEKIGLKPELERIKEKKIRAGVGKTRGRKYKKKVGPLIITSGKSDFNKSAKNMIGINTVTVKSLNIELLAPGAVAGRLTIWTKSAIEELEKEKLYS